MTGRRTMLLVIGLALLGIAGIVGVLLSGSAWGDRLMFAIAALPPVCGGWRLWTSRDAA